MDFARTDLPGAIMQTPDLLASVRLTRNTSRLMLGREPRRVVVGHPSHHDQFWQWRRGAHYECQRRVTTQGPDLLRLCRIGDVELGGECSGLEFRGEVVEEGLAFQIRPERK